MKDTRKKSFAGQGIFPYWWAFTLLIPIRNFFLSPKKLMQRLALRKEWTVLEVGPGPGYFSVPISRFLTEGKLVLADIQQEMLDYAKKRLQKKSITNVAYHLCDGETFAFSDNTFDCIFMVAVLGEVESKKEYLLEFHRILKNDGVLSISELAGDADKMTPDELLGFLQQAGFRQKDFFGNEKTYTVNFAKEVM